MPPDQMKKTTLNFHKVLPTSKMKRTYPPELTSLLIAMLHKNPDNRPTWADILKYNPVRDVLKDLVKQHPHIVQLMASETRRKLKQVVRFVEDLDELDDRIRDAYGDFSPHIAKVDRSKPVSMLENDRKFTSKRPLPKLEYSDQEDGEEDGEEEEEDYQQSVINKRNGPKDPKSYKAHNQPKKLITESFKSVQSGQAELKGKGNSHFIQAPEKDGKKLLPSQHEEEEEEDESPSEEEEEEEKPTKPRNPNDSYESSAKSVKKVQRDYESSKGEEEELDHTLEESKMHSMRSKPF